jgi:hypothetical protein
MRKVTNKKCYRVSNRKSKRVMAKCASKKNAEKQLRLLRAIQNNKNFVPRKSAKKGRMQKGGAESWAAFFGFGSKKEEGAPVVPSTTSGSGQSVNPVSSGNHGVVNNNTTSTSP